MNKGTRQRIEIAKRRIREMPIPKEEKVIVHRKPYSRGAKEFLSSMEVGDEKKHDERLSWRNLQSIACVMRRDYGCMYTFRTINGIRTIFRFR